MKFKKIFSAVASVALSLSLLASNVTAMETNAELTLMSESVTQAIDLSQLTANASEVSYGADYASISFNSEEDSNILQEEIVVPDNSHETSEESTLAVSPRASAIPLSSLTILNIGVGNTGYDSMGNAVWNTIPYSSSAGDTIASCSIETTDFSYVCIRVLQWGYTTSSYVKLDNTSPTYIREVSALNAYGQEASAGETVYGFIDDYIFAIPSGKTSSTARIIGYYDQVSPMVTKEIKVNFSWVTPTGEAPTTPTLTYNIQNENDYAVLHGIDSTMEYRLVTADEKNSNSTNIQWHSISGTALLIPIYDFEYFIQIRYKATDETVPSLYREFTVTTRSAGPSSYVEYDGISEILAIYTSEKQIEIALGDGASYVAISPAYYLVDTFIDAISEGGFNRIYIRYAATATEPASNALVLTLYGRNPNTPDAVYYENGVLYNLTSDMVFRFNGGAWYSTQYSAVNVTSFMSSTETTLLEIRYMPTDSASCSAIREITLPILA